MARVNREEAIVYSSGDQAQKSREIKILDNTMLPLQCIANNPNIGQVLLSREEAQKQRKIKDKDIDKDNVKRKSKGK